MKKATYVLLPLLVQLVGGCSDDNPAADQAKVERAAPRETGSTAIADEKLVVAFGDSLYAGYQLEQGEGFAPELERTLEARGIAVRVHNAGVSGDTSTGGLQRLAFTLAGLERKPDLVLVGLGANDMLRGLDPAKTRANLDAILTELKSRNIDVVLTGMVAAPNLGKDYAKAFNAIHPDLAKKHDVPFYPFFLQDVFGRRELMLEDGMHPNERGVDAIVNQIAPLVASRL